MEYDAALITLDEVDRLGDDNVLMLLSRAREAGKVDVPIGIISISNKVNFREQMTERVKEQPRGTTSSSSTPTTASSYARFSRTVRTRSRKGS